MSDRRRQAELAARGYDVFPITWPDLVDRPTAAMADLRAARDARRHGSGVAALRD